MFFSSQDERVLYTLHASPAITKKSLQELFANEHPTDIQAYHECSFWGNMSTAGSAFDMTTYGVTFPTIAAAKRAFALHNWRPLPGDAMPQSATRFPICLSTRPPTSVFPPTPTARPRNIFTESVGYGERVLYELLKEFGGISFLCISSQGSVVLFEREEDALAAEEGIHEVAPGLSLRAYGAAELLLCNLQLGKEEENVRSMFLSSHIQKVTTLHDGVAVAELADTAEAMIAITSPRSPICPKAVMSFYIHHFHPPLTLQVVPPDPTPRCETGDLRVATRKLQEALGRCSQLEETLRRSEAEKHELVQDVQRLSREAEIAESSTASRVAQEELVKIKSDNETLRCEVEELKKAVSSANKFDRNHYIALLFNARHRTALAKHEASASKKALNTTISRANVVIQTLKERHERLGRDVSRSREQAKKANEKVKSLGEHIEELKELLDEQDDKLHDLASDATKRLEEEISLLKLNLKNYKWQTTQDAREMQRLRQSLQHQSQQIEDLGFKLSDANRDAYDLRRRLADANREIEVLKQQRTPHSPWQKAAEEAAKRWRRHDQEKWGQTKWTPRLAYERYQDRLAEFKHFNFNQDRPLTFEAIPWPVLLSPLDLKLEEICWESVEKFVKGIREHTGPNHKAVLKEARVIFHPDQWTKHKVLASVPDDQLRTALQSAGNIVSQAMNRINMS
ncbi:hypothetical protein CCMSSC00406_0009376 [Pleurotus cornucopiae]|uniref:Uncharacterized protein n=1 Tax=Pleurotus cornucopiae TaxID=5321 RepID=A0ACB7IPF1_PLECO|nr:hypothetical protein CCMSSC00406_0009376 [Pleurotus cornucopiae]